VDKVDIVSFFDILVVDKTDKKWTMYLVKEGKLIMVLATAHKLGRSLLKYFFVCIKGGSLAVSSVANTYNDFLADLIVLRALLHSPSCLDFSDFYMYL
jgi:hypothetical protein